MSDKFDDLRSLFDDEEDDEGHPASEALPDWESSEDVPRMDTGELSGRLGLAGQFDWQGASGDEPGASDAEPPLEFDWQGDDPASETGAAPSGSGLGVTGQLDWQRVSGQEADSSEDDDAWMQVFTDDDDGTASGGQVLPDWLAEANNGQPAEPDVPDWLLAEAGSEDTAPDEQAFPDWLLSDEDKKDATQPDAPDWQDDMQAAAEDGEWLAGIADPAAPAARTSFPDLESDDFLNLFGGEEEEEDDISNILRGIGLSADQTPAEPADEAWFEDEEPAEPASELPAWLTTIEEYGAEEAEPDELPLPAEDDFLAEIGGMDDELWAGSASESAVEPLQDIDSLLAGYDAMESHLPDTDRRLLDLNPDIERLLADDDTYDYDESELPDDTSEALVAELPDWLTEVGASVDEMSAAALLRQGQQDRPLEELDERFQALHDAGLNLGQSTPEEGTSALFRSLLPGVREVLPPAPVVHASDVGVVGDLILNDAQQAKIKQLQEMVAAGSVLEQKPRGTPAIDRTLDSPNMRNIFDEEMETPAEESPLERAKAASYGRGRRRIKADRLFVTLAVAAAVLLPFFVKALRIGDLPPGAFVAASSAGHAFQAVDRLRVGDYVLVAAEYGPTAAAELDSLTEALLRHIVERGGRPVIVSGNAVGLLHVDNLLQRISSDQAVPLQVNQDYYVTRYIVAGVIGTRAFARSVASYVTTDINGQATLLPVRAVSDFALIVVVSERAEEVRSWVEQVAPSAGAVPLVAAVSYAAAPLAEPYVLSGSNSTLSGLAGMLVGYQDAYTYTEMLGAAGRPSQVQPVVPTTPPTQVPLVEVTPEVTEPVESATPLPPTELPTGTPVPTETPVMPTETPTGTPTETATLTPTATETPLFPASFTPIPTLNPGAGGPGDTGGAPVITGIINTNQGVNVRENPGREFAVVTILPGSSVVQVIGRNGDESWYKILMEDGTEGWISASLVTIQSPATPTPPPAGKRLPAGLLVQLATPTSEGLDAPPEVTAEVAEITAEATVEVTAPPEKMEPKTALPVTTAYRDERWYSMTFGIIVIVAVITLGAVVNVLRSLLTRRGRS
jgi:hypothetical protein